MKSGKFDKEKGRHKENERGDRVGRRKGEGFFHSYGKKKRAEKGEWMKREDASGKGKGTDEEKTKEREKTRGKCGIAKKRRGNFTRSFEKSHKKACRQRKKQRERAGR